MKITKINASFSQKIQLHQFEPIEVFMAVEGELELGETQKIPELQERLFNIAKVGVEAQIEKLK